MSLFYFKIKKSFFFMTSQRSISRMCANKAFDNYELEDLGRHISSGLNITNIIFYQIFIVTTFIEILVTLQ